MSCQVRVPVLAWAEQQWAPTAMVALAEALSAQAVAEAVVVVVAVAIMAGEEASSGGSHTEQLALFDAQLACPVQESSRSCLSM